MNKGYSKRKKCSLVIIICILFLFSVIFVIGIYHHYANMLDSQTAAHRWKGDNDKTFVQNTVLFSLDKLIDQTEIKAFRKTVDRELTVISTDEENNQSKQWIDCYSAKSRKTISSEHNSIIIDIFGIGGDYFFFHPLELKSGGYISEIDISKDQIVLDENAAWKLFGSADIVGKHVKIGQRELTISGVVKTESDKYSNKTKTDEGKVYLHYNCFSSITNTGINTYEIVLPEPIKGFAYNIIETNFSTGSEEIISNSNRFSISSILQRAVNMDKMVIQNKGIAYPYFENAARLIEVRLAYILIMAIVLVSGFILVSIYGLSRYLNKKSLYKGGDHKDGEYYIKKYKESL